MPAATAEARPPELLLCAVAAAMAALCFGLIAVVAAPEAASSRAVDVHAGDPRDVGRPAG